MTRLAGFVAALALLSVAGCKSTPPPTEDAPKPPVARAGEPPVDIPPGIVVKINPTNRTMNDLGPADAQSGDSNYEVGALFENHTDYEISEIKAELQGIGAGGIEAPEFAKDFVVTEFEGGDLQYRGTLLPHVRAQALTHVRVTAAEKQSMGGYWIVVRAAKGYLKPKDLKEPGHFLSLAARGDLATLKPLIDQDPGLANFVDSGSKVTLGHIAAMTGNVALLELLAERKADLSAGNKGGWTPLHLAMARNAHKTLQFLLDHGADPNKRASNGSPPLLGAVELKDEKAIRMLLAKGADINLASDPGYTPLMWATAANTPKIVKLLLEYHPDLEAKDKEGNTALMHAAKSEKTDTLKVLLAAKPKLNETQNRPPNMTALHLAAGFERAAAVRLLLAAGADPNVKDAEGKTPLQRATGKCIEILRAAGAK
jgi:ankyrin repeat protein